MKRISVYGKIALGWAGLLVAQMVAGIVIPVPATQPPHALYWLALSDLLVVLALAWVASRCDWKGWKLGISLAAIPLAIALIDFLEGFIFLTHIGLDWARVAEETVLTYVLVMPIWTWLFGRGERPEHVWPAHPRSLLRKIGMFILSDAIYVVLYFAAGTIILPLVKAFYATQYLPPFGKLIALQFLLRGPLFVAICLLLLRMIGLPRLRAGLAVGLVFTILSGIAPLLTPNPFLPDHVRWVHLCEVTSSNFLFGMFIGWMWAEARTRVSVLHQAA